MAFASGTSGAFIAGTAFIMTADSIFLAAASAKLGILGEREPASGFLLITHTAGLGPWHMMFSAPDPGRHRCSSASCSVFELLYSGKTQDAPCQGGDHPSGSQVTCICVPVRARQARHDGSKEGVDRAPF